MRTRNYFFPIIILFFVSSVFVFGIFKTPIGDIVNGVVQRILLPLLEIGRNSTPDNVQKIAELLEKTNNYQTLQKENKALRDQFQTSVPTSTRLFPVKIIGAPSFVPGITAPEVFVIDGGKNNIKIGQVVVYKSNMVGQVSAVSQNLSQVRLVGNKQSSFPAKTQKTSALGVIKGLGNNEMLFDNVLLSENLTVGDLVVTYPDVNTQGQGFPPDLIVGLIVSVDKKPSALFQTAKVKHVLDFSKLSTVFVLTN